MIRTARRLAAIVLMSLALGSATAFAEDDITIAKREAQAVIDACWDLSLELRLGTNAQSREGFVDSVMCLNDAILAQMEPLMGKDHPLTQGEAEKLLQQARDALGIFYWAIFNENAGCVPGCGTMWFTAHLNWTADMLENMLHNIYFMRIHYADRRRD